MEIGVPLTAVPNQGEADVICGMLRAAGIKCADRPAQTGGLPGLMGSAGWREILVSDDDLEAARKLLDGRPT